MKENFEKFLGDVVDKLDKAEIEQLHACCGGERKMQKFKGSKYYGKLGTKRDRLMDCLSFLNSSTGQPSLPALCLSVQDTHNVIPRQKSEGFPLKNLAWGELGY